MTTLRRSIFCGIATLLFYTNAPMLWAQSAPKEHKCFSIRVRLNGALLVGPQVVILGTRENASAASLQGGCYKIPPDLLTEKTLDVAFEVPGSKIHLFAIATGFFAGPWDIDLEDKKFGREVSLPKHARAKQACFVVFHVGEPERQIVQTGCRTPVLAKNEMPSK